MGCSPNTQLCDGCGGPGAAVRLIAADGQVEPGWFCWPCADKQTTPVPPGSGLAAALALVDPQKQWRRSRAGARWVARRLDRLAARSDAYSGGGR